ncbi:hypothetical protein A0H81_10318 [Grifola frondosa]|uniref:Uncharacterized protein n=1 Tax=Grifola frondosa TaxID=5627 RepID=A0A1C7LYT0_GRIFR|nr:hypothetical protein A0H81_10318 [Grifola frondosa]
MLTFLPPERCLTGRLPIPAGSQHPQDLHPEARRTDDVQLMSAASPNLRTRSRAIPLLCICSTQVSDENQRLRFVALYARV